MAGARRLAVLLAAVVALAGCASTAAMSGASDPAATSPVTGPHALVPTPSALPALDPSFTHSRNVPISDGARMLETTFPSPAMHMRRNVVVLLPAGYATETTRRYPVVVLMHGTSSSPLAFVQLGNLLQTQVSPGVGSFIGVLPDGNGPAVKNSWYANIPSQQMGTSTAVDLRSWVTKTFRTNGSYSYAGLSSGGFAAAYMPLLDHQPIHAACGLSGYYNGDIVPLAGNGAAQQQESALAHIQQEPDFTFLSYGTADKETRAQTLPYAAALRAAGKHVTLKTYPGGHAWSVWRAGFLQCLRLIVPAS